MHVAHYNIIVVGKLQIFSKPLKSVFFFLVGKPYVTELSVSELDITKISTEKIFNQKYVNT